MLMKAPAGIPVGTLVYFLNGTTDTVAADLTIDVPVDNVTAFQNAGWTAINEAGSIALEDAKVLVGTPSGFAAAQLAGSVTALPKESTGVVTLLPAADYPRAVMLQTTCTEVFADGDGAQPTVKLGTEGNDDEFAATTVFDDEAAGSREIFAGTLPADEDLIATCTAATGTATGALRVTVTAVPIVSA